MKKVAVVILNWNGVSLLEKFLPSVVRFSPEATVYVADNASDDLSVEMLRLRFPMVRVIRNTQNFGFAQGYNEALRFVEEDIYALVNSDVEVTQSWLAPMLTLLESNPDIAIVQPKILDYKNKQRFEYAGAGGGFIDRYGYPFCRGRVFETVEIDNGQYDDSVPVFWASGACMVIRKEVFRNLGGFDSRFFAHMEEIDLCWRAYNRNYKAFYCGQSTVYHVGGATLNEQHPQKAYLNFRNSLFMLTKNLPKNKLAVTLFVRMILDGLAALRFLFLGKFQHFAAVFNAHISFYSSFVTVYKQRDCYQRLDFFKVQSIVWRYFVNGKKKFG